MITEEKRQLLALFAEGRQLYTMQSFREAADKFIEALKIDREDGPSMVYLARCKELMRNPPPDDWDGVFNAKVK
jgi:hypothetical protein